MMSDWLRNLIRALIYIVIGLALSFGFTALWIIGWVFIFDTLDCIEKTEKLENRIEKLEKSMEKTDERQTESPTRD